MKLKQISTQSGTLKVLTMHTNRQTVVIPLQNSTESNWGAIDSPEGWSLDFTALSITSVGHIVMKKQRYTQNLTSQWFSKFCWLNAVLMKFIIKAVVSSTDFTELVISWIISYICKKIYNFTVRKMRLSYIGIWKRAPFLQALFMNNALLLCAWMH